MVTKAYINSLLQDAEFFDPYNQAQVEEAILAAYANGLPGWVPSGDNILRRATPLEAEQWAIWAETQKAQLLRSLLAFATGRNLDLIGLGPPPVVRRLNEPDDDYRLRIANAHTRLSLGNLQGIEEQVIELNTDVTDSYAAVSLNRQNVHVYNVKANATVLTPEEKSVLNTYYMGRGTKIGGVEIEMQDPTIVPFKIVIEGVFDRTLYGEAVVERRIRDSVYQFIIDNERIGNTWVASKLCGAADVAELVNTPKAEYRVPTAFAGTTTAAFDDDADLGKVVAELTAQSDYNRAHLFYCMRDADNVRITLRGRNDPA